MSMQNALDRTPKARRLRYLGWVLLAEILLAAWLSLQGHWQLAQAGEARAADLLHISRATAYQITEYLDTLQQGVSVFAGDQHELLVRLRSDPNDEASLGELQTKVKRHFPEALGFVLAGPDHPPIYDPFSVHVGDVCLGDLAQVVEADAGWSGPRIHPNPHTYHFDIVAPWSQGLFMVSFKPDRLAAILRGRELPRQSLVLTARAPADLIEITSSGSRDLLDGANQLDEASLQTATARADVPHSNWILLAFDDPQYLLQLRQQLFFDGIGKLLVMAVLLAGMGALLIRADLYRQRAEQANNLKSRFLSMISHDIRTPMHSLLGSVQLLEDTKAPAIQREQLSGVRTAAEHILSLLSDLLDMSRLEAGKLKLNVREFDLRKSVDELTQIFRAQALQKGLHFSVEFDPTIPSRLMGDPVRLQQIISNLIGNAIKFTSEGRVALTLRCTAQTQEGIQLHVAVQDTGEGIPQDQQQELFGEYVQASLRSGRTQGGSGLGLTICKQLAELMGGSVGVHSKNDRGSLFWLDLPLKIQTGYVPRRAESPALAPSLAPSGMVLIVEDDAVSLRVTARMMKKLGWRCRLATSAKTAMLELGHTKVDLVLLDGRLPDGDGLTLIPSLRRVLALQYDRPIPVFAVTGDNDLEQRTRYFAAGFDEHLPKPLKQQDLHRAIERYYPDPRTHMPSLDPTNEQLFDPACIRRMLDLRPKDPIAMLGRLFELFGNESSVQMRQLQAALSAQDREQVREVAQKLCASATSMGAIHVAAIARAIELAVDRVEIAELQAMHLQLTVELSRARDYAQQFQPKNVSALPA